MAVRKLGGPGQFAVTKDFKITSGLLGSRSDFTCKACGDRSTGRKVTKTTDFAGQPFPSAACKHCSATNVFRRTTGDYVHWSSKLDVESVPEAA